MSQYFISKVLRLSALEFLVLSVLLASPVTASAGALAVFSSFFSKVGEDSMMVDAPTLNSQTMPLLRGATNIDPNPSKGGGDIRVVDDTALLAESGPSGTLADIEERPMGSDQISIYVVRGGDTLSQIADMFRVSINTIRWANDIAPGASIQPGETLVILPVTGVRHTVKKGDTLESITKKYEGDLDEVLSYNNLLSDTELTVGEVVVVPNGEITVPKSTPSSSKKIAGGSGASISGYFMKPVNGIRTQGIHGYNGVDIAAPSGTAIVAAAPGQVIVSRGAGWNGGYGTYIVIRHSNGTQTLYAHNSQNIVYTGDSVVQGQVIGYVGNSGRSTGPHLHFEVRGAKNPF